MSGQSCRYCCVHYGGLESRSGCVISSKLIWREGAGVSPGSLMSDSHKISMKDVLHLLSADTNPIYRHYEATLCLHITWTLSPRSTLTEIKTRTCRPHSVVSYSCPCRLLWQHWVFFFFFFEASRFTLHAALRGNYAVFQKEKKNWKQPTGIFFRYTLILLAASSLFGLEWPMIYGGYQQQPLDRLFAALTESGGSNNGRSLNR